MIDVMTFRTACAEDGVELTPQEAKDTVMCYDKFLTSIKEAFEFCPNFYQDISNRTTEEKLEDIKRLKKKGCKMTLKEYNRLQKTIMRVCELEGYDNGNQNF
jgi:hypothetical protein